MLSYIIQTIVFQLFFLIIYDVFFKKETFFYWNRLYLLITPILALIIPFVKIAKFQHVVPQDYIITLPEVFIGEKPVANVSINDIAPVAIETHNLWSWHLLFFSGMSIVSILFVFKIFRLVKLILKNPRLKKRKYTIVQLLNSTSAFSFFNYIFLGEQIDIKEKDAILKHEMVHVEQKHTLDLLFFEALKIVFWFNPLIYIYQRKMQTLHEFIADAEALKYQDKTQYYQNLLSQVFETKNISFINPFFKQSLIKKRIIMLQKSKSKQVKLFKYALLIPALLLMFVYSSCSSRKETTSKKEPSLIEQINKLNDAIKSKEEITLEEEKQAMIKLSKTLNKTKYKNSKDVPFTQVDKMPIFPGCEGLTYDEQKKCLVQGVLKHVNSNFNTKIGKEIGLSGEQTVNVILKISTEGNVIDVRSRAPHPDLETEAIRVVKSLPKMIPGENNGKKVNVLYSLPIVFEVIN